jgi:stage V sporulation protein AB
MLAAGLTEVVNVFPILAKRIRLDKQIIMLVMAIVLGKIFGSIFQWLFFIHH